MGRETLVRSPATKDQLRWILPILLQISITIRKRMFRRLLDWEQRGIRMLESCHRRLTATDTEHYLSTCTTDLRALHSYNRTEGTCYGPVARNIHGID